MTSQVTNIVNGPSKFTLGSRFLDLYDEGTGRLRDEQFVTFSAEDPSGSLTLQVWITSLEYESGGGHCWNFRGRLTSECLQRLEDRTGYLFSVKGHYNSKRHQGTLTLS